MNLWRYLKDSLFQSCAFLILLVVIDVLLAVSSPLDKSLIDIFYLDVLLIVAGIVFFTAGFFSWRARYRDLYRDLAQGKNPDFSVPQGSNLESRLMRDLVSYKNSQASLKSEALEKNLEELNDYIVKWVHEIKIPISVCELLLERLAELSQPENQLSEKMRIEVERIKFLVNQVLYAGKASSFFEDFQVEECSLASLTREAVKRNAAFFIAKNIEVIVGEIDATVLTDKKGLAYILDQVLHNASKYCDNGGKIEIRVVEDDRFVRLYLRDDGMGIAPKDVTRVFDKGFTGDNGRKVTRSTGMGLYFSKMIADKMGHQLEVRSEQGHFTEFCIILDKFSDYYDVTKM